jgi:uncharacterized protein YecT (DUF1311 family)
VIAPLVAVAALALSPPVIHETFTPLRCPADPQAQLELEGCAEKAILTSDRRIDALNAQIFTRLAARDRATFVAGERAWLRYRHASCLTAASKYAGGTLASLVDANCVAARNRTHLHEQASLLHDLKTP